MLAPREHPARVTSPRVIRGLPLVALARTREQSARTYKPEGRMILAANGWVLWPILALVVRVLIFSLIFFPAALIVAHLVPDRTALAPA